MKRQNFTIVAVGIFAAAALLNFDSDNADRRERIYSRAMSMREFIEADEKLLAKHDGLLRQVDQLLETASRADAVGEPARRLHESAVRKKKELSDKRAELHDVLDKHVDEYNALADEFNRARKSVFFWSTHRPAALDRLARRNRAS